MAETARREAEKHELLEWGNDDEGQGRARERRSDGWGSCGGSCCTTLSPFSGELPNCPWAAAVCWVAESRSAFGRRLFSCERLRHDSCLDACCSLFLTSAGNSSASNAVVSALENNKELGFR
jgi:hypothetical protein